MAEFIDMGGYGGFVWPAFAVTAMALVGVLVASLRDLRAREADLARLQSQRRTGRTAARKAEPAAEALSPRP